jgi:hypothetical protein
MPLAEAPKPWLQLLVNNEHGCMKMDEKSLQSMMCANKAMCKAVLRCMRRWRLAVPVRVTCVCACAQCCST